MAVRTPPLIDAHKLEQAAECLRVLAHPSRLRMLELALRHPLTVGELADACGLKVAVTSGHLRLLERCGIFAATRKGRFRYYTAAKPCLAVFIDCIRNNL